MLYDVFRAGQQLTEASRVPALITAVAVPAAVGLWLARRRPQDERIAARWLGQFLRAAASLAVCVGALHLLLIFLPGSLIRESSRPLELPMAETLANALIGPPEIDRLKLALSALALAAILIGTARMSYRLLQDSSAARERLDRLRRPDPIRGGLGSAHLCTPDEFRRFAVPHDDGLILRGEFWGRPRWGWRPARLDRGGRGLSLSGEDLARGVLAIGGPGSGKTQSVVLPAIADWMMAGRSLIIVDPQNELTARAKQFAAVTGHRVLVHDPLSEQSARINLAWNIQSSSDARAVADTLMPMSEMASGQKVQHEGANALLAACLLKFNTVGEILMQLAKPRRLAQRLAEQQDDTQLLAMPFLITLKDHPQLAAQMAATLATALTGWADESVRAATASTDFTSADLVGQPTAIILTCPSRQRATYARYLGMTLRKLILDLDSIAAEKGGALPLPVAVVVDEFPTLGKLDTLVADVNLVRKRRIAMLIAAQTKGQFHLIYGEPATDTLFAGLATQIVMGGCDQETAEFFSRASGLATERVSFRLGQASQIRQRALLTPDEIQAPTRGNSTIFARFVTEDYAAQAILLARLMRLYEREDWKARLADVDPDNEDR